MDIGRVGLWTFILDNHPSSVVRDLAREIEDMGWPILWRPESRGRDALISAATILEATTTLNVATGIAIIYNRHPIATAAAQKTLAESSDGRFLLGLGVSHRPSVEGIRGLDYGTPYSDMVAYLEAMRKAPYAGPEPQKRPLTILAALGPRMLKLSADASDGAHPYFTPVEHTAYAREIMGPGPLLLPEVMVAIDQDVERARDLARPTVARYLSLPNYANNLVRMGFTEAELEPSNDRLVDAIVACGGMDTAVDRVNDHLAAGADHVSVQVLADFDDLEIHRRRWRELSEALEL